MVTAEGPFWAKHGTCGVGVGIWEARRITWSQLQTVYVLHNRNDECFLLKVTHKSNPCSALLWILVYSQCDGESIISVLGRYACRFRLRYKRMPSLSKRRNILARSGIEVIEVRG
jgi:hypothetical protein